MRAFSHGCVRVQNPREFATVVLGWTPEDVAAKLDSKASETVRLKQKLPVHISYFTAWPDDQGKIVYFNDIYGRDRPIENARTSTLVAQR
jgi:murein L,D-transpeptidase YcbB/YkuD